MFATSDPLQAVLEASWQGSLVILFILLVRPLLGLRVPPRWRTWLWALVLVRLLVPAFLLPPSPASIQNIRAVDRPFEVAARTWRANPGLRGLGPDADELSPSAAPASA